MRFVLIRDDASIEDIDEAIENLRAKAKRAVIASTRAEIMADVDELLEMRTVAPNVGAGG